MVCEFQARLRAAAAAGTVECAAAAGRGTCRRVPRSTQTFGCRGRHGFQVVPAVASGSVAQPVPHGMSGKWPLGSEVRRKAVGDGALLYDVSRWGNLPTETFDPVLLARHGQIVGQARGRGTAWFVAVQNHSWVLRHYQRGGLVSAVSRDRYWWQGEEQT